MSDETLKPELLARAVFDRRFAALARANVDLAQIATWDPNLDRRTRLLVPVDVQAFVVPKEGGEATVPLTGGPLDPKPFDKGEPRPPGVHLHWALPDALLRGKQVDAPEGQPGGPRLEFPRLPDRWVVIRAVMPNGSPKAALQGWVIDARTGSVTPLAKYAGTPASPPPEAPVFDPLDAGRGGSIMWTASYAASAGRFGFYDPLVDLPDAQTAPQGLAGDQAVYVVSGWWSDLAHDPLASSTTRASLDDRLKQALGGFAVHDADDKAIEGEDPRLHRVRSQLGLKSPATATKLEAAAADGSFVKTLHQVEIVTPVPVAAAEKVLLAPARPGYATLLHGAVLGVPIGGKVPDGADDRPAPDEVRVALGLDVDDLIAAFGAGVFGAKPEHRLAAERLAAAFTSDLLDRLGSSDGIADLEEREHGDQFWSLPGAPLPNAKPDRLRGQDGGPMGPTSVGRKGRGAAKARVPKVKKASAIAAKLKWKNQPDLVPAKKGAKAPARTIAEAVETRAPSAGAPAEVREVTRPAPRWFRPQPPMIALRGARPSHRHHGDGLYEANGLLRCRYPRECLPGWDGVVGGDVVVPSLGSGAVPDEVLRVVREAVALNGYAYAWLAAAGAGKNEERRKAFEIRLAAEMVRLYGADGRYDGTTHWAADGAAGLAADDAWAPVSATRAIFDRQITSSLARFSTAPGAPPSPIAITTWRQPWSPIWVEWRVKLEGSDETEGWALSGLDLVPGDPPPGTPLSFEFTGRSPVGQGVSTALAKGIERWLAAENQRDLSGDSTLSDDDEAALARLGDFLRPLDLVSASLDGVREQLLGMPYNGCATYGPPGPDGKARPIASGLPTPLFGGTLRVAELRLVDAFGRVLNVPVESVATTTELELEKDPSGIRLRPRLQHAARWLFRLVDPALPLEDDPATAKEAFVDQLDPGAAVNPVAGFLLPDHIDEALEFFDVAGTPLGQLGHDPIGGAVAWEPAPGRPLPPDAGPLAGLSARERIVGELAAGLVRADLAARSGASPPSSSALSTMLRAVDTTLWAVDTFASVGSASVAALVGRPIAVVRATLRFEAPDDLAEVDVTHVDGPAARRAVFAALAERRFAFQLGALARSDDALLGFFVDDDYEHLHLVDKVVAGVALESGRLRGQLGLLGQTAQPAVEPLDHPYVVGEDVLYLRPGQTLRLTLLMLPAGKVHLTSGVLPRKALALSEDWVGAGLARLMPSVRVGPVLVDPSEVRLPLVHLLGDKQTFTRRTGPLTWRDDPILAATQTALLPRLPHEVQEGWVRVTPEEPEGQS